MAKPAPPSDDASEEEAPARAAPLARKRCLKVLDDSSSSSEAEAPALAARRLPARRVQASVAKKVAVAKEAAAEKVAVEETAAQAAARAADALRKRTARQKSDADPLSASMPFTALAGRFANWGATKIERLRAWGVATTMTDPWTTVGAFGSADEELVRRSGMEIMGFSAGLVVHLWKLVRLELGLESAEASAENLVRALRGANTARMRKARQRLAPPPPGRSCAAAVTRVGENQR